VLAEVGRVPADVSIEGRRFETPGTQRLEAVAPAAQPPRQALAPRRAFTVAPELALADDELRRDELARMRFLALFTLVVAPLTAVLMHFVPGDPGARLLHLGGLGLGTLAAASFLAGVRTCAAYRAPRAFAFALAITLASVSGLAYWGPYSALVMVMSFGGFVLAQSSQPGLFLSVAVLGGGAHLLVGLSIALRVIEDPRPVAGISGSLPAQLAALILIHVILVATRTVGRMTRKKSDARAHERDRALIELGRREALVGELREELAVAQKGDMVGRYTGANVGGYRLARVIGRGASSEVYEGLRERDQTRAAVKLLHPHVLAAPEHFRRFMQEARISALFDSPHVVRTLDIPAPDEAVPYIAMEFLHGDTLAGVLQRSPTMPIAEVVELVRQVGRGLTVAHRAGVVHRDLKPANVFRAVDKAGQVTWKVLDFGVCRLMTSALALTQPGMVLGTPHYMAPEQLQGKTLDAQADLYALGVIAYRALTGRTPFAGDDLRKVLSDIVVGTATRPSAYVDVPVGVDDVLAVALAKRPEDRFADAEALAVALARAARGERPIVEGPKRPLR
jgi:tRNA A-37 threonylcarbamoyl transferase component Bud32